MIPYFPLLCLHAIYTIIPDCNISIFSLYLFGQFVSKRASKMNTKISIFRFVKKGMGWGVGVPVWKTLAINLLQLSLKLENKVSGRLAKMSASVSGLWTSGDKGGTLGRNHSAPARPGISICECSLYTIDLLFLRLVLSRPSLCMSRFLLRVRISACPVPFGSC